MRLPVNAQQQRPGATGRRVTAAALGRQQQAPALASGNGRQRQHPTVAAAAGQQQQQVLAAAVEMEQQAASDLRPPAAAGSAGAEQPPPTAEREVPRTLHQALSTFFTNPSPLLILLGIAGLLAWRARSPLHPAADLAVPAAVAAWWCLQEWVVHALLLHSKRDWLGSRIHIGHHKKPYYHVSIDDPPIVLGFMAASLALFELGFGGSELALTAALSYYTCGLLYEFTHYIVHTRYLPNSTLAKRIRMHHLLHHTKNEAYWLAFTVPEVDRLFGTAPQPSGVRMSAMARAALKSSRGRGPKASVHE